VEVEEEEGEGRREKGEGRREKGEGRREKGGLADKYMQCGCNSDTGARRGGKQRRCAWALAVYVYQPVFCQQFCHLACL